MQRLYGTDYDDLLQGKAGNDFLWGARGDDTLIGGAGNDTLEGTSGGDIYLYNRGDGSDYIEEWGYTNEIDRHITLYGL